MFDADLYQIEMSGLLQEAVLRLERQHPGLVIYSVSIWTDPNAARSAVSVDTEEHSADQVRRSEAWARKHYDRLMAEGDEAGAQRFAPKPGARNDNPANFRLRELAMLEHRAFQPGWEMETQGGCWRELEPALLETQQRALTVFASLPCHPRAELAVNSPRDWYDHPVELRFAAT